MDLIDQYLTDVAAHLPKDQRRDVIAELRDILARMVEEREAALGRHLTSLELQELLRGFGHPLAVAGRYARVQQLIGPEMLPFYVRALQLTVGAILALKAIAAILRAAVHGQPFSSFPAWAGGLANTLLVAFAVVTLIAIGLDKAGAGRRFAAAWRPKVSGAPRASAMAALLRPARQLDRAVGTAVAAVFLLCWTGVIPLRALVLSYAPGGLDLRLSSSWDAFYWPVLLYGAAGLGLNLLDLLRPGSGRVSAGAKALACAAGCLMAVMLLQRQPLLAVDSAVLGAEDLANARLLLPLVLDLNLVVGAVILGGQAIMQLRRLVRASADASTMGAQA